MDKNNTNTARKLPLVPMRGNVLFPKATISFDVSRKSSIVALEYSVENERYVFLALQKDLTVENPVEADIHEIGTVALVRQVIKMPGNTVKVIAEGVRRGVINSYSNENNITMVTAEDFSDDSLENGGEDIDPAFIRVAQDIFEEYARASGKVSTEAIIEITTCDEAGRLADLIALHSFMRNDKKQDILEVNNQRERLETAVRFIHYEMGLLGVQKEILAKLRINIEQNQKEYYLKEQLKIIQDELGDKDGIAGDIKEYRNKIKTLKLPAAVEEKAEKELRRLNRTSSASGESSVIRDYLDVLLDMPWNVSTKDTLDIKKAEAILEKDHYGLEKIKERIVEFIAVRQNAPKADTPIICLVGPPGVGKTSIAKSVARAAGRKYVRISLGGVKDEADIRGHRKTYIGAMPGRIITSVRQAKANNPLILFDEIDKMGKDFRGDPSSALLEVLDSAQNMEFRDHYLEVPFDISDIIFICTANSVENIPAALKDRLEIINLSSYSDDEKYNIAAKFLIPKQLAKHGLKKTQLKLRTDAVYHIVSEYTKEAGVRQLERNIGKICRKAVKAILAGDAKNVTVDKENLGDFLGSVKITADKIFQTPQIGIARGLAWTSLGGVTLSIEVNTMKGTGKLELTGSMGNVMKESAKAAISYIRSKASELKISKSFYKDTDIHIHIPEGAVPKDGPSAGITMATAMISALTDTPVRNDVAMTGEITIRGRVLPIGGLKEKVTAAKTAGVHKVIIPADNSGDYDELPLYLKEGLEFIFAADMQEVMDNSLML